jgi:hypothetical protein
MLAVAVSSQPELRHNAQPVEPSQGGTMGKIVNSAFVSLDGVINHMERWHFDFTDDESDVIALQRWRRHSWRHAVRRRP